MKLSVRGDWTTLKRVLCYTFLFGLAAHAFCYFNAFFSHDSLMVYQDDTLWQISLGRFLQPVYLLVRGRIAAPFLVGLLSLTWLSAAVYLIVRLLDIRSHAATVLTCGVLATNAALTYANATYLPWVDIYMLALLLAVLGVYAFQNFRFGFLWGAIPLCLSLGLYQAYFQAAVMLLLMLLVKRLFDENDAKAALIACLKALAMLLIALLMYYAAYRAVLWATGVEAASGENGLAGVGDYSKVSLLSLFIDTYLYPIKYLLIPRTHNRALIAGLNVLIVALTGVGVVKIVRAKKLTGASLLLLIALLGLMPFGMNAASFLSKGLTHSLMIFSFFLVYVFALFVWDYIGRIRAAGAAGAGLFRALRAVLAAALAVVIFSGVVYANKVYVMKELQNKTTLSIMTRVVDRMEQCEGYEAGETPVAIVGMPARLIADRPGYEDVDGEGTTNSFGITYYQTYTWYFQNILAYPVRLVPEAQRDALAGSPEVMGMPAFPDADSIQFIDGVLLVKLSD